MTLAAGYLVMMLFSVSMGDVSLWNHPCPDMACVDAIIAQAWESKSLVRLRVYEAPVEVNKVSLVPIGAPIKDLWFN